MLLIQAIIVWGLLTAMSGIGQFLYDWQTLIGSGLALAAAYWAVKPVYAQLELTRTQSNGVLREMLLDRQSEFQQAIAAVKKHVEKPIREVYQPDRWEEGRPISSERAFHDSQSMSVVLTWLKVEYHWRDSETVEASKQSLVQSIEVLRDALDAVHAPDSVHQEWIDDEGEHHEIAADDWAAILTRGEEAIGEIDGLRSAAVKAATAMLNALNADRYGIRRRLSEVDAALLGRA
ncbi:hypothetical protein JQK15_13575 [Sphingobium sp. BHU LFT2]|uniref:hypothetical protein n=1 Tax=Sphingobium sp. BHU LFT2 TaxID=2807634 RepID=UPI001BEBF066|nr:hypothetical protein [Sphingobium sp. BHU LFT2]MBT2244569.1 hypothetical protein [Sphingobium sp. BHU LFT2]